MNRQWCIWTRSPQTELWVLIPRIIILASTSSIASPLAMNRVPHLRRIDTANINWSKVDLKVLPRHPEYTLFCLSNKRRKLVHEMQSYHHACLVKSLVITVRKKKKEKKAKNARGKFQNLWFVPQLVLHPVSPLGWWIRPRTIPLNFISPRIPNLNKLVAIHVSYLNEKEYWNRSFKYQNFLQVYTYINWMIKCIPTCNTE